MEEALGLLIGIAIWIYFAQRKKKREEEEKSIPKQDNTKVEDTKNKRLEERLEKLKVLSEKVTALKTIEINEINEFKPFLAENEKAIVEKGGDEKLFQFLKLDVFLQDFRKKVESNKLGTIQEFDAEQIERVLIDRASRDPLLALTEDMNDSLAVMEGRKKNSYNSNLEEMFKVGDYLQPSLLKEIATMNFYNSMAFAMVLFYLENKKLLFFEIYEAFDKLGAFDNTWQKNVAANLQSIDNRLALLNDQMGQLNDNFYKLSEKSDDIVNELKQGFGNMNSKLDTSNLLQAITAYQVYKINKNTKPLGQ
ncbi:MAG: hypothetical protein IPG89_11240 [Bacteroidetes bacterium]|nr:hypothetical protein [Bacteroidota bacterium]